MKKNIGLLILFIIISVCSCEQHQMVELSGKKFVGNSIGYSLPSISLDMDNGMVPVEGFKGKIVLLHFWATWCPTCIQELPAINKYCDLMKDKDIVFIGVNVDNNGRAILPSFKAKQPVNFQNAYDPSASLSHSFEIFKYPETLVISREGVLMDKIIGGTDWTSKTMVNYTQLLLNMR